MNQKDINHEWLDVEDIIWNILDGNQSSWGQNFKVCQAKIEALIRAKNLTSLFEGTHAAKDLEEIIDMKINCSVRDYFTPLKDKIKSYEEDGKIRSALILIENELKNLDSDKGMFPQSNLLYGELIAWRSKICAKGIKLPDMRLPEISNSIN